jgi:competence protein ComEA
MRTQRTGRAGFILASLLFAPLLVNAAGGTATTKPPQTRLVGVVNVNTATPAQLELLPGIGPARARSIVEHRTKSGPFKRVEDLGEVSGIGEHALGRIRPHCSIAGKTTARLEQ